MCGILAVVFMTNIYLGIFFIVYGIVLIIVSLNISKPLFDMQKNVMVKQDRYLNGIRNIIENKIGINALHREKFFADEYKQNIVPYEKHVLRYRFLECLCRQAPNILDQVCLVVFLFIGGNLVLNQKISIGEFLMMYQYMAYFSDPITTACAILMRYRANMVHVARIDKLSDDAKIPKETKKYMTNTENLFFTEKYDFYKGKEKTDFLFHIDKLKIKKGGLYVIKGENGSGKSTLIKAIIGLLPKEGHIDGGVIEYNGVDITGNEKCLKSLRGSNIGMIFQNTERAMCPVRTIKSQLYESIFSNEAVKDKRKAKRIIDEKAVHMLEQMNIKNAIKVLNSYPFELSGGMNQRVGIMMAMLMKPDLLLADEPTSALDVIAQRQVVDIFKDIKCSGDTSMIIVSHNINVVRELADKIIVMKSGRIVEYEDTEIIMDYPKQEYTKQLISAVPVLRRECADEYNIRA